MKYFSPIIFAILSSVALTAPIAHASSDPMASSVGVKPGAKLGCPPGRTENYSNNVGLMPCIEDSGGLTGSPPVVTPPVTPPVFQNCATSTLNWNVGSASCAGVISALTHGNAGTVLSNNGNDGSAQFSCVNGNWIGPVNETCVQPFLPKNPCEPTTVYWNASLASDQSACTADLGKIRDGSTVTATNKNPAFNNPGNTSVWSCQNGDWVIQSGTCGTVKKSCDAKAVYWDNYLNPNPPMDVCYGYTTSAMDGQSSGSVWNLNSYFTSNSTAIYVCDNGDWRQVSGYCDVYESGIDSGGSTGSCNNEEIVTSSYTYQNGCVETWDSRVCCGYLGGMYACSSHLISSTYSCP